MINSLTAGALCQDSREPFPQTDYAGVADLTRRKERATLSHREKVYVGQAESQCSPGSLDSGAQRQPSIVLFFLPGHPSVSRLGLWSYALALLGMIGGSAAQNILAPETSKGGPA